MSVLDIIKTRKAKENYSKDVQKATDLFLEQKEAIQAIKNTKGLLEIKNYLQRGIEICENYLDECKDQVEWNRKHERRAAYREQLKFIENLENS